MPQRDKELQNCKTCFIQPYSDQYPKYRRIRIIASDNDPVITEYPETMFCKEGYESFDRGQGHKKSNGISKDQNLILPESMAWYVLYNSRTEAASMVGTARKNENSAAFLRVSFCVSPPMMVAAALDTPGIIEITWKNPIFRALG